MNTLLCLISSVIISWVKIWISRCSCSASKKRNMWMNVSVQKFFVLWNKVNHLVLHNCLLEIHCVRQSSDLLMLKYLFCCLGHLTINLWVIPPMICVVCFGKFKHWKIDFIYMCMCMYMYIYLLIYVKYSWWSDPSQQSCTHPTSHSFSSSPCAIWHEKTGRTKPRKLVDQGKDSSVGEGKKGKATSEVKAITHHFPQANWCPLSFQTVAKTLSSSSFPDFYCLTWYYVVWSIPLAISGHLRQLYSFSAFCPLQPTC